MSVEPPSKIGPGSGKEPGPVKKEGPRGPDFKEYIEKVDEASEEMKGKKKKKGQVQEEEEAAGPMVAQPDLTNKHGKEGSPLEIQKVKKAPKLQPEEVQKKQAPPKPFSYMPSGASEEPPPPDEETPNAFIETFSTETPNQQQQQTPQNAQVPPTPTPSQTPEEDAEQTVPLSEEEFPEEQIQPVEIEESPVLPEEETLTQNIPQPITQPQSIPQAKQTEQPLVEKKETVQQIPKKEEEKEAIFKTPSSALSAKEAKPSDAYKTREEIEKAGGVLPSTGKEETETPSTAGMSIPKEESLKGVEGKPKKEEEKVEAAETIEGQTYIAGHQIETPIPEIQAVQEPFLSKEVEAIMLQMIGRITYMKTQGVSETTITLNGPDFVDSKFYNAQIKIQEHSTAKGQFKVEILFDTQEAERLAEKNVASLIAAFQAPEYAKKNMKFDISIARKSDVGEVKRIPGEEKEQDEQNT